MPYQQKLGNYHGLYCDGEKPANPVCEEHRDKIEKSIPTKVKDIALKRNAEDYLQGMKPIIVALNRVQSDSCKISDVVHVWKKLQDDLKESNQPTTVMKKLLSRTKQALTPAHFLANILDPKHQAKYLSDDEVDTAMAHCSEHYAKCLPSVINMRAQTVHVQTVHVQRRNSHLGIIPDIVAITGKSSK